MKNYLFKYYPLFIIGFAIIVATQFFIVPSALVIFENIKTGEIGIFESVCLRIFPRLEVEMMRLPASFFTQKIEQLAFRLSLLGVIIPFTPYFLRTQVFSYKTNNASFETRARFFFYFIVLLSTFSWVYEIPHLATLGGLYNPISFFAFLQPQVPSVGFLRLVMLVYIITCIASILGIKKLYSTSAFSFLFIYLYGFQQCFGKIDNGYSTVVLVLLILPWYLNSKNEVKGLYLRVIQLMVVLPYFLAAIEKISLSGIDWVSGHTLSHYLDKTIAFKLPLLLISFLSLAVIVFQAGFIFTINRTRFRIPFMVFGIIFHSAISLIMDIGSFLHPWTFGYIFLLDHLTFHLNKREQL